MKYIAESYDTLIRKSYGYNQQEQDTSSSWKLLRELYESNYIQSTDVVDRIPRKIHQIWLGSPLPDRFKKWCDTWQVFHPSWEYKLWTDVDIDGLDMTKRDVYMAATNQGMRSDILRYEILSRQGGLYVDTDFECLKPFDDLLYLRFFVGIAYSPKIEVYCGLIGSEPHGHIIGHCVNDLKGGYTGNDGNKIMDATGPYHITRCLLSGAREQPDGAVAFPMDFFYPFPNSMRFTDTARTYIRPVSYAIHHWKTSWL